MSYKDLGRQREYQALWYKRNKTKLIARVRLNEKKTTQEIRRKIKEFFSSHPCIDCGETDWVVLEFDHCKGDKKQAVASMIHRGYSWKAISEEINKCEVRCANCHRRKTARERGHYRHNT